MNTRELCRMPAQAQALFHWTCRFLLRLAEPRPRSKAHERFVRALREAMRKQCAGHSLDAFLPSELRALRTAFALAEGFAKHIPSALARYKEALGISCGHRKTRSAV